MNSLPRKIVVYFIVAIIGINFGSVALGEIDQCMNQSCFFCNGIPITHKQPVHTDDSTGHVCHSSSENIPCNLKQNPDLNEHIFIVSSVKEDQQRIDDFPLFFIRELFLTQVFRENVTINKLWHMMFPYTWHL